MPWLNFKKANLLLCVQPETPEYRAACKLWDLYIRTKNEFVQRGDYDEDDDDGDDARETPGGATEDEARLDRENFLIVFVNKMVMCEIEEWVVSGSSSGCSQS